MCGGFVDWCAFTWEAFATLVTGFLAVCGAFLIGIRQMKIQEKQVELQDLALRSDLFERRYSVYERVRQFTIYSMRLVENQDRETEQQFLAAMGEAKFLFDDAVVSGVDEIWAKKCELDALMGDMKHIYEIQGHYGDGNPKRKHDALIWFDQRLTSLPQLFHEMKLGGKLVARDS